MQNFTAEAHLDRLVRADPAITAHIERELRYGQTRWTEVWLACVMALFGAGLLADGDTFSAPAFRVVRFFVGEDAAGAAGVAVGAARLGALWRHGGRRRSPLVRVAGCATGFLFYTGLALGFVLAFAAVPTGLICGVLAAAELHASGRSARDAVACDSLGLRQRRRVRDQPPS
ncbi:hypothetical protein [Enterovirga sp.]|uniref:hypothetical protein n=1 Tax=Enterovirga sp. TaxID=2026350 RepID=UPI0026193F9A|nr:hypothetical protein [Enterovirga sp.]MDB5590642.1 hypothetical protein [Enterovirga sp.]